MDWQPIETMPVNYDVEDPPICVVWVADGGVRGKGCAALGMKFRDDSAPKAIGFRGNWKITHWCLVEPPK